jgi:Polyphosphate kinase 2 (PPK2)
VLQGIDGAGKDGTCWHVIKAMDPQGVSVTGFKQPTEGERDHDFLWRVHPHAPGRGRVAIFNRSHYEDVLIVRVHKLAPKKVWKPRYDFINDWEKLLAEENNTTILKFFLFISKEEQLARFKARLDNPAHQWKISASDYAERDKWDDYIEVFEAAMKCCKAAGGVIHLRSARQCADDLEALRFLAYRKRRRFARRFIGCGAWGRASTAEAGSHDQPTDRWTHWLRARAGRGCWRSPRRCCGGQVRP